MLRIIHQEVAASRAWDSFVAGDGKKNETFMKYQRRVGAEARTPLPTEVSESERVAAVDRVKQRLGRLYRAPLQA